MPAKPSGEIKTITVRQKQKNGDIYVLERTIKYDPEKKQNKILSTKLVSKIPKYSENPVPTRPKKAKNEKNENSSGDFTAERTNTGMMDILEEIGKSSGIDEAIYDSTDVGTAQKIISLARYLIATDGHSLPGIQTWQFTHKLPYEHGISEDIYHDLFNDVGRDESLQQNFFRQRCKNLKKGDALAYDSTTISTYSDNQIDARYGFNKAHDGLKTIKQLTLYSIENRQPIAFTKEPGNLSDVSAIGKGINQLKALGIKVPEVVTDNGFYSESNLSDLLQSKMDFLMLIKNNITWVKPEVEKVMNSIMSFSNMCPFDHSIYGTTVSVMHEFSKIRKYNSNKTGALKGSEEIFTKKLYLNIFFNRAKQTADTINFNNDLYELKQLVEDGTPISNLKISAQKKVEKYFEIKVKGDKTTLIPKDDAINEANKYHGYFVLVSNKEKDTFEALKKYRKRELIEEFFRAEKQQTDASRIRVWDSYSLRGRMFVQFVALCYYEYFNEKVRVLKEQLGKETGDPVHDSKENLKNEEKLKSWLKNTPLYLQLQWFDTVETVCISSNVRKQRWSTGITERDALYLRLLGVEST